MESKRWRWGILGSGKIAQDFVTSLELLPEADVVAVGSRNKKDAESFAQRFPKYHIVPYGSYKEVVSDPKVDLVYIAPIHPHHKDAAILALEHGKHILMEKPFTVSAKETEEVLRLAKEKNLFVMEAMWTRFFPAIAKVRELLHSGTIGDVVAVTADFGFKAGNVPRLTDLELGGGALLDIGVYVISFASMIFGGEFPSLIKATGELTDKKVDDHTFITLGYKPGQFASLYCTFKAHTPCEVSIVGTKGRIKVHSPFWCTQRITLYFNDLQSTQDLEFPLPSAHNAKFNFRDSVGLHFQAKHVMQCLREGKTNSTVMSVEETLVIMKIMDEVRKQIGLVYPADH